jgi:hypothetical protein
MPETQAEEARHVLAGFFAFLSLTGTSQSRCQSQEIAGNGRQHEVIGSNFVANGLIFLPRPTWYPIGKWE